MGDLIKKVQADLDKIEEGAPPIPGFIAKKMGEKATGACSVASFGRATAPRDSSISEDGAPSQGEPRENGRNVTFCLSEVAVEGGAPTERFERC